MYINSTSKGLHHPSFKSLVSAKKIWFPTVVELQLASWIQITQWTCHGHCGIKLHSWHVADTVKSNSSVEGCQHTVDDIVNNESQNCLVLPWLIEKKMKKQCKAFCVSLTPRRQNSGCMAETADSSFLLWSHQLKLFSAYFFFKRKRRAETPMPRTYLKLLRTVAENC